MPETIMSVFGRARELMKAAYIVAASALALLLIGIFVSSSDIGAPSIHDAQQAKVDTISRTYGVKVVSYSYLSSITVERAGKKQRCTFPTDNQIISDAPLNCVDLPPMIP